MSRPGLIASIFIITFIFIGLVAYFVSGSAGRGTAFLAIGLIIFSFVLASILSFVIARHIPPPPVPQPAAREPEKPGRAPAAIDEKAVQILSILQKKGRLIDFLQEDITGYQDSQIGAAVRNIHKGCREALTEYVALAPVMKETEGAVVAIEKGFDPSAVRLTGNVVGNPPFQGRLAHSGWRVVKTSLPPIPQNQDASIIEPAEVELE